MSLAFNYKLAQGLMACTGEMKVLRVCSGNSGTIAQGRSLLMMSVNGLASRKADRGWCRRPPITKPPIDTSANQPR
jgi:hypothetical protein